MFHGRRLIREIPLHGVKWDEDLSDIHAVVAGVLILRLHHPDDGVRNPVQLNGLADSFARSEEHTSELQSRQYLVCRLLLEKKKQKTPTEVIIRLAQPVHKRHNNTSRGSG